LAESAQSCDGVINGYRFDRFEVDVRTGELRRDGIRLKLQDKPFQLLIALLERPGDLLTNEELQRRLWPAETFVDFALGLKVAVKKLRKALGDHAGAPRYVENLPRRGYRFIATVEPVNHTVTRLTAVASAMATCWRESLREKTCVSICPQRPFRSFHIA